MVLLSFLLDIAFFPCFLLVFNTIIALKYKFGIMSMLKIGISIFIIFFLIRLLPLELGHSIAVSGFSCFSYYENICSCIACFLFSKFIIEEKKVRYLHILLSIMTLIPFLGAVLFEEIGIYSFILISRLAQKDRKYNNIGVYIVSVVILMFVMQIANWKGIIPDMRPQNIFLINEKDGLSYYEITPINERKEKVAKVISKLQGVENGRMVFIEDEKVAYTFSRSSIITSPYGVDPVDYDTRNGNLLEIEICNSKIKTFKYQTFTPSLIPVENIFISGKEGIIVYGDTKMSFRLLNTFFSREFGRYYNQVDLFKLYNHNMNDSILIIHNQSDTFEIFTE